VERVWIIGRWGAGGGVKPQGFCSCGKRESGIFKKGGSNWRNARGRGIPVVVSRTQKKTWVGHGRHRILGKR